MANEERRVVTTLPLEIGGSVRPAGTLLALEPAVAEALLAAGRAVWGEDEPGAPLAPEPPSLAPARAQEPTHKPELTRTDDAE